MDHDGLRTVLASAQDDTLPLLEGLFAEAPVAFQIFGADGDCVWLNAAFRRLFGLLPPDYNVLRDRTVEKGQLELIRRAFAGETAVIPPVWYDPRESGQLPLGEGRRVGVAATFFPLRDGFGRVAHVAVLYEDLSETMAQREVAEAARAEAERSEHRAQFLADAGKLLAASLDSERTLSSVAQLAVPEFADFCIVDLIDPGNEEVRRVAIAHADPEKLSLLEELRALYPPTRSSPAPAACAIRDGVTHFLPECDEAGWRSHTVDERHFAILRRLNVRSLVAVPLVLRGRITGALSFAYTDSGRRYRVPDLRVAEELASRAALAIDNARLFAEAVVARREAEHERMRLHALVTQAPAYVLILRGPEHRLELMNPLGAHLLVEMSEPLGRPLVELLPEPMRFRIALWDQVYRTGAALEAREVAVPAVGALLAEDDRYFNFVLQPLRGPGGGVDGVMSFAFDVSGEVLARRRIDAAFQEAAAANRAKDEFLAMLGHELRNPLAPIATAVQLMQLRGDSDRARELEVIDRQVKHVIRLVDDLLDVSRITRGKIELKRVRVEVSQVVANAVEMASPLLEQRRHRLRVEVPRQGLAVDVDDARLAQVVSNLLTNAAKYTEPGGEIAVSAGSEGEDAVICVRDNGRGIDPQMLPRIFDLFVQGERSPDRAEGGLGLGLALVRSLVMMHGGSVAALSDGLGQGSEFLVRLPLSGEGALDAVKSVAEPAPRESARRRVLLVDDNQDAAELLGEVLRTAGHDVEVAHDGAEALGLLRRFVPDVAVLDIGLPVMDGYELARRLRADPALGQLRCIAVTGYGQETDRARSRKAGFELHLVKPVDVSALLSALDRPATSSR